MKKLVILAGVVAACVMGAPATAAAKPGWKACGEATGSFPVPGFAPVRATLKPINARFVRCGPARRFAHRMYFRQECVRCDDPSTYRTGDRIRFRGFVCKASGRPVEGPTRFSCRRGRRIINFRAIVHV